MERAYNIKFIPHKRSSIYVKPIENCIVYAKNKSSAEELAKAIAKDKNKGSDYMTHQYKYIIERESIKE